MTKPILITLLLLVSSGCASPPAPLEKFVAREIEFSELKQLQMGTTKADQLTENFGAPKAIHPYSDKYDKGEFWDYENVSFFIDPVSKLVLTATLTLKESDPLHKQEAALRHFKGTTFTVKDVGWIARHAYSHEAIYNSNDRVISMTVNKLRKTVSVISLSALKQSTVAIKN